MIVTRSNNELDGLGGCRERGGEIARLTLEFGGLQGADSQNERSVNFLDVTQRRKLLLRLIGELHEFRSQRQPHRLELVHPAAENCAFENIARKPLFLPLVNDDAAGEMAAGRAAA